MIVLVQLVVLQCGPRCKAWGNGCDAVACPPARYASMRPPLQSLGERVVPDCVAVAAVKLQ